MLATLQDFLIQHGALGMFLAAFLAGSFVPFSSEVVMVSLLAAGTPALDLLLWGTAGNAAGGIFNYGVGSLGKIEWITRFAKVPPDKLERGLRHVRRYGAWAGLLAWIPLLGSGVTVAMGYLRTHIIPSFFNIVTGKFARYALLIAAYEAL